MNKKYFFTGCLFIAILGSLQGQSISLTRPAFNPVTPEAADVQKYASYPVDYSTGIPNISIPLFEVRSGDIVVPITLTYHSSGLKPREASGRAGTGWTLNAEPSVMRTIRGIPDDRSTNKSGRYYEGDRTLPEVGNLTQAQEYTRKVADNEYDGESDVYSYSLNPGGGTCYMMGEKKPKNMLVTYPRTDDKVEYNVLEDLLWIRNGDGLVYKFGRGSNARETNGTDIIRWLCDEIASLRTEAKVTFSYLSAFPLRGVIGMSGAKSIETDPNLTTYHLTYTNWETYTYYWWEWNGSTIQRINKGYPSGSGGGGGSESWDLTRSKLNQISFNGHTVQFSYTTLNFIETLTQMIVTDNNGNQIRSIQFYITRYNSGTDLTKLDSIRISAPGCDARTYRFSYYGQDMVPSRTTKSIDHWGFANGSKDNNEGVVPTIYAELGFKRPGQPYQTDIVRDTIPGRYRESEASWAKHGVLWQIHHPEGVVTTFEYEGNSGAFDMYYSGSHSPAYFLPVGGLRVFRIEESVVKPGLGRRMVSERKYRYGIKSDSDLGQPLLGGGVIKHIVTNLDYQSVQFYSDGSSVRSWSAMPVSNITFNNGSAVLYSFVQEDSYSEGTGAILTTKYYYDVAPHKYALLLYWAEGDNTRTKIGTGFYDLKAAQKSNPDKRIIRKKMFPGFDKYNTNHLNKLLTFDRPYDVYEPSGDRGSDVMQGQLVKVEQYKNRDTLVSSTRYTYTMKAYPGGRAVYVSKPYRTLTYKPTWNDPNYTENKKIYDEFNTVFGDSHWDMNTSYWNELQMDTTYQYFYTNGVCQQVGSTKSYTYDASHMHPTAVTTTIQPGQSITTQQSITDEYTYHSMIVNTLASHLHFVNTDGMHSVIDFLPNNRPDKVRYKTNKMSTFDTKLTYHEYDAYGNVAELSTNDGRHTCYIWSYNNQYLVAEIDHVSYSQLLTALGNKDQTWIKNLGNKKEPSADDWNLLNGLRTTFKTTSPSTLVSTFTYKPLLGVSSITDPSGMTTHHVLDNFGRLTQSYRLENGVKKVVAEHKYHQGASTGLATVDFFVTGINISSGSILVGGRDVEVEVYIEGGSGDFACDWVLYHLDSGRTCGSSSTPIPGNSFTFKPEFDPSVMNKINKLIIHVYDRATGKKQSFSTYFYVKEK